MKQNFRKYFVIFNLAIVGLENTDKFSKFHEVACIDAVSLFTSINVPRTVDHIIDIIYENPDLYFSENNLGTVPPLTKFKDFFMGVLLQYNCFETLNGFYRQDQGLSMGGKMSPALSNIFLNILETTIIQKFIDQKSLVFYVRYVDDIFIIVRKRMINSILVQLNNFDENLGFTLDKMENNSIKYLDTLVVLENDKLKLQQFLKSESVIMNYKKAVAPLQYKNSCLSGEIFRANNCTSDSDSLELALKYLKQKFINNDYPERLINNKISEIKNRDFGPNPYKLIHQTERDDPEFKFYNLGLPYTSYRCSKIATSLKKISKKYTPNYRLNVCFSTITLENIILPRLKPVKPLKFIPNSVYLFTCECIEATYVGQTKKILKSRVWQHGNRKNSHIHEHIFSCSEYQEALINNHGIDPNDTKRRDFLFSHFTCLKSNLNNYFERTAYEGMCITQLQPTLNKQLKFDKQNLLCTCIIKITSKDALES